ATDVGSSDVHAFLTRMKSAKDHYDVLDISRIATADEIKDAYHKLARQFHPDHFHQGDANLRLEVGSAFARIAQAYEVLSNAQQRGAYDDKRAQKPTAQVRTTTDSRKESPPPPEKKENSRAETSFRRGMEALEQNQFDEATRLLGEAATLEPREARYR